jgi:signal peptidase II
VVPRYYPIFNLADSAIVCGGILTVILALRGYHLDGTRGVDEPRVDEPHVDEPRVDEHAGRPAGPGAPAQENTEPAGPAEP